MLLIICKEIVGLLKILHDFYNVFQIGLNIVISILTIIFMVIKKGRR